MDSWSISGARMECGGCEVEGELMPGGAFDGGSAGVIWRAV